MARQSNLDHLTTLLGQCLGRIDESAFRLQQLGEDDEDLEAAAVFEQEATSLQELVGSLVDSQDAPEHCELNRIVEQSVAACVEELGMPILLRLRLTRELPAIGCTPSHIAYAVQRALVIAAGRLEASGELIVTTREGEDQRVLLELESRGGRRDRHLHERSLTLCEFVASFRGHCHIDDDGRDNLLVVIELPQALALDDR